MTIVIPDREIIRRSFAGVDRNALAEALNSSRNTIDQIAGGHIIPSAKRAKEIEVKTNGLVKKEILRPDIFE